MMDRQAQWEFNAAAKFLVKSAIDLRNRGFVDTTLNTHSRHQVYIGAPRGIGHSHTIADIAHTFFNKCLMVSPNMGSSLVLESIGWSEFQSQKDHIYTTLFNAERLLKGHNLNDIEVILMNMPIGVAFNPENSPISTSLFRMFKNPLVIIVG